MDPLLALLSLARACVLAQRGEGASMRILCKRVDDSWEGVVHDGPLGAVRGSHKDGSVVLTVGSEHHAFRVEDARRVAVVRGADGALEVQDVLDETWIARLAGISVQLAECGELPFTVFDDPQRLFAFRVGGECIMFERQILAPDVDGALELLDAEVRAHEPTVRRMTDTESKQYMQLTRALLGKVRGLYLGELMLCDAGVYRGVWGVSVCAPIGEWRVVVCDRELMYFDQYGALRPVERHVTPAALRIWRGVVLGV